MKILTILLSFILAFKPIYSKAIKNKNSHHVEQLDLTKENDFVEIVNTDNFIYKLHCFDKEGFCDKVKNDLDYAFNVLSKTFEFYQPVVFEAFVEDLELKYGMTDALAGVTDINYVPLKSSKNYSSSPVASYLYPQALAKQLKLNKKPDYKKNDFIMLISNCEYCKNNEFRSLFIHELFHGLGFSTRNYMYLLDDRDDYTSEDAQQSIDYHEDEHYAIFPYRVPFYGEIMREITSVEDYYRHINNTQISSFPPFNIYDKYIVTLDSGESLFKDLSFYYKELNRKCLPKDGSSLLVKNFANKDAKECFKKLSHNTQKTISGHIEKFFKSNTLGFLTKDGDVVPLQTFDNSYEPGTSITHPRNALFDVLVDKFSEDDPDYDYIYEHLYDPDTEDFKKEGILEYYDDNYILYFTEGEDISVEEMIEQYPNNKKHPLIGNGIVKIMKTLGWTEKGKQRSKKVYYIDESIHLPEDKSFEYENRIRYEVMKGQVEEEEEEPSIDFEIELAYEIDEEETSVDFETEFATEIDEEEPSVDFETELVNEIDEEPSIDFETELVNEIDEEEPSIDFEIELTYEIKEEEPSVDFKTEIDEEEPSDDFETELAYKVDEESETEISYEVDGSETELPYEVEESEMELPYEVEESETELMLEVKETELFDSIDEFETALSYDSNESIDEVEVEDEFTVFVDQDSDFDYDSDIEIEEEL